MQPSAGDCVSEETTAVYQSRLLPLLAVQSETVLQHAPMLSCLKWTRQYCGTIRTWHSLQQTMLWHAAHFCVS